MSLYPASLYQRKTKPINKEAYKDMYAQSIENPEKFWAEEAKRLDWFSPWNQVKSGSLSEANVRWFEGGKLNVCYNCLDRHLEHHANEIAFYWEGNEPGLSRQLSYQDLYEAVCQFANALKNRGIKKGDCVCIYMPMIPEAIIAILACARIGAIHSVVFGGFSAESLCSRIQDAKASCLITADEIQRGDKIIPLENNVAYALKNCPHLHTVFVVEDKKKDRLSPYFDYHEAVKNQEKTCPCEIMEAEDPLFILYTSGSTGKPKGILHTTAGYLLYTHTTFQVTFDYQAGEVYWCTADIGWITGHSYLVYGPLSNRATSVIFAGIPTYPNPSRYWDIIDKYKVNIFYTAPTALRLLMASGNTFLESSSRESLRCLGSVGEPINPEVWEWYFHQVGKERCPIIDTWWQTETGGFLITPIVGITDLKPGSASHPFFGIKPQLIDNELYIEGSWPGQMRDIYGDHARFISQYLSNHPGKYCSGDGAYQDDEGYFWITGRVDDVIKVSGHRIGSAEVENAFLESPEVAEAAAIGIPHAIKGESICVFVVLKNQQKANESLKQILKDIVKQYLGSFASPDTIYFVKDIPKTRSGKMMRRLLRKITQGEKENLGDISTLANPDSIESLIEAVFKENS